MPMDSELKYSLVFLFGLINVLSLIGNVMVLLSVSKFYRLRSQFCFRFLASLAVADITVSLTAMPLNILSIIYGEWPFEKWFCLFWISCDVMFCTASILHLCLIALDRYVAISRPLIYQRLMTKGKFIGSILFIWLISGLLSFLPTFLGLIHREKEPDFSNCGLNVNLPYAIVSSILSFYLPFLIICILYARILNIARKQSFQLKANTRSSPTMKSEAKAIKTIGLLVGFFAGCWLPFFLVYLIKPFYKVNPISESVEILVTWIGYINSVVNPVLYCFMQREFRTAFLKLLSGILPQKLLSCILKGNHLSGSEYTTTNITQYLNGPFSGNPQSHLMNKQ